MRRRRLPATLLWPLTLGALLAACSAPGGDAPSRSGSATSESPATSTSTPEPTPAGSVAGTVVHFTAGSSVVEVTIAEDNPTTRGFVSMLPMTLEFEDFADQEKIASPSRALDYTGAAGMTPQVGDLFSYMPWGNLGFFYDVSGLGHSEDLVRLGTTDDLDQVMKLDGRRVTIEVAG